MVEHFSFEQPIVDLKAQLEKLKSDDTQKPSKDKNILIKDLENKVTDLEKEIYSNMNRWQKVQVSRHPQRPYTLAYIEMIAKDFTELHGDRNMGDDHAIVGGFGKIGHQSVMIIGHQKGKNTKMRQYRNFGMANPEGYRKALRLMKLAEKFNKPIITFVDTPGAYPGIEAEKRGQGESIAKNLFEMAALEVPIITFIIGEGASGGALGLAVANKVYMLENTWYSVISPESCSSILWRSWDHKEKAAECLKLTAQDMLEHKLIDGIIKETMGGAHNDPALTAKEIKKQLLKDIKSLSSLSKDEIVHQRITKYEAMGKVDIAE